MRIASVVARQVLDCKARPLVEVEITTDTGHVGRGASPTGTSVGAHEAVVLRDGNRAEYDGLSVHRAVSAVTDEIAPVLVGAELDDPRSLRCATSWQCASRCSKTSRLVRGGP